MHSEDQAENGRPRGEDAPMPPVTSRPAVSTPLPGEGRMAPPFAGRPSVVDASLEAPVTSEDESVAEPESLPWEEMDDQGTVEPAFEADVSETEAALAALSRVGPKPEEDFPLDAFIIPEHTRHVPSGLEAQPASADPVHTPVTELAEKLEKLSHRLRVEEPDAVLARLAAGDKLDAMLAGLLAGYLAGRK